MLVLRFMWRYKIKFRWKRNLKPKKVENEGNEEIASQFTVQHYNVSRGSY